MTERINYTIYEAGRRDAAYLTHQVYGLARVGAAATESCLAIDLAKGGYRELFEVIADLAAEAGMEIEELERLAKVGPVFGRSKGKDAA